MAHGFKSLISSIADSLRGPAREREVVPRPLPPASLASDWEDASLVCSALVATGASLEEVRARLHDIGTSNRTIWSVLDTHVRSQQPDLQVPYSTFPVIGAIEDDLLELQASVAAARDRGDPKEIIDAGLARITEADRVQREYYTMIRTASEI